MEHRPITLRALTVASIEDITPGLRRLTLTGDQLGEFDPVDAGPEVPRQPAFDTSAPDDHVKVFLPVDGSITLPVQDDGHLDWPTDPAPLARDYTVRRFDPERAELEIDALTGHDGPGASWARTAAVGDVVHVAGPAHSLEHPVEQGPVVLIGDETALPAIARFHDELPDDTEVRTVVFVDAEHADYPLPRPSTVVVRPHQDTTDLTAHVERALEGLDDPFVWGAVEFSEARTLRKLLAAHGIDRSRSYVVHYWRRDVVDRIASIMEAEHALWQLTDLMSPYALRCAATLGIADAIADGAHDATAVAAAVGADPGATTTLLGYLATKDVVASGDDGLALTAIGELLLDGDERGWREHLDLRGGTGHMDASLAGMLHAVTTGGPGYDALHHRSFWDALAADERLGRSFDDHLAEWAAQWGPPVVAAPVWLESTRVLDVGGGAGAFAAALLEAHDHLHVTVVDLPGTAARARRLLAEHGLTTRGEAVDGSFFEALPTGFDTVTLVQVLHDWPDAPAGEILRQVAAAMPADGRLIVAERLTDDAERSAEHAEMDLLMLSLFGARERSIEDYRALGAGAGLRLDAVHPMGPLGLLEFSLAAPDV